jgi:hypothetical protein
VTRVAVVWIASLLRLACLLFFPGLAVWAWRAGGRRRLWRLTGVAVGLVLAFAAFAASAAGGNALVSTHGYGYTAPWSLLVHALLLGLPMVVVAAVVPWAGRRIGSAVGLFLIGLGTAILAWLAGTVLLLLVFYGPFR